MPALIMSKCVFLHVPKTGGTWAQTALRQMGIVHATLLDERGIWHPSAAQVRAALPHAPIIATVRHPVPWLRSFWRFFQRRAWRSAAYAAGGVTVLNPLMELASPTFAQFAERYVNRRPGYVSEMFAQFTDVADHVCHAERLRDELPAALAACGQPYIAEVFARTPDANRSVDFNTDCPTEIVDAIEKAERRTIEKFYS